MVSDEHTVAVPAGVHGEALLLKVMRMQGRGSALARIKTCVCASRTGIVMRGSTQHMYSHQAVCDQHIDSLLHMMRSQKWKCLSYGSHSHMESYHKLSSNSNFPDCVLHITEGFEPLRCTMSTGRSDADLVCLA